MTLVLGIFLVWLGWFIFKEILTKTYTIPKMIARVHIIPLNSYH